MDKKVFLAVTICAAIFLVWQNVYLKPLEQRRQMEAAQQQAASPPPAPQGSVSPGSKDAVKNSDKIQVIALESNALHVAISTVGGTVSSVGFPEYRGKKTDNLGELIGSEGQLELNTPSQEWTYLSKVNYALKARDEDAAGHERVVLAYDDAAFGP